jgi:O-acetylserine/cysteine efflux transporter
MGRKTARLHAGSILISARGMEIAFLLALARSIPNQPNRCGARANTRQSTAQLPRIEEFLRPDSPNSPDALAPPELKLSHLGFLCLVDGQPCRSRPSISTAAEPFVQARDQHDDVARRPHPAMREGFGFGGGKFRSTLETSGATPASLSPRDLLLALLAVCVWGSNFVVVRWGLDRVPPFTLAALRFLFSAFPAVLLVRKPPATWINIAAFGMILGFGQFGLLFLGMRIGITPALASLVLQMQAFFTVGLAALLVREALRINNLVALALAAGGLVVIAMNGGNSATPEGLTLVLVAALAWATCNMIARSAGTSRMVAYMAWSSLFAAPPLLACALILEGAQPLAATLARPGLPMVAIIFWQSAMNTLLAYGIWNSLLTRYRAAQVAPLSLLVPIVAILFSTLLIHERLQDWKLLACGLILGGLAINQFGAVRSRRA